MKVRMRHLLVADNILLDNMTNKVSVIGLFDAINIPADKESIVVRFGVTAQLMFDEIPNGDVIVEISIVKPSGGIEKSINMPLTKEQFPDNNQSYKNIPLIVNFSALEFTEIGTYNIKITVNGETPEASSVSSFETIKLPTKEIE